MNAVMPRLTMFEDGITAVDTGICAARRWTPHTSWCPAARAAIIDTGPNTAVPLILAALEQLQLAPDAGGLPVPHPRSPRSCRRRGSADARPAARHLRRASARRASHDRSRQAHRRHARVYGDGAVFEAVRRDPAHRSASACAIAQDGSRFELRRPRLRMRAHAGPRAASPGHRRSRRQQHLHRRHLRHLLPRVRHGARARGSCRTTTPTQFDPGPAQGIHHRG